MSDSLEPSATTPAVATKPMLNTRALILGMVALIIAVFAQFSLKSERTQVATVMYIISAMVFAASLRPATPMTIEFPSEALAPASTPKPKAALLPNIGTFRWPTSKVEEKPTTARRTGFFQNWRYYTLSDVLKGRQPNLPTLPDVEAPPETVTEPIVVVAEPLPETLTTSQIDSQPVPSDSSALVAVEAPTTVTATVVSPDSPPITVTTWSGFERPQNLFVTTDGVLFVLDTARHNLSRLDLEGHIIKQWALPTLPVLQTQNYVLSQNGHKLYVADAERGLIYVVELSEGPTA